MIDQSADDDHGGANAGALQILPRMAIEKAAGAEVMARIRDETGICMVVAVPNSGWVAPISRCLRDIGGFISRTTAKSKPKRFDEETVSIIAGQISAGERVLGVAPDPKVMLPPIFYEAADIFLEISAADIDLMSSLIEKVTGEKPDGLDGVAVPTDFEKIVSAVRKGSTAEQCVNRLGHSNTRLAAAPADTKGIVPVGELVGYGPAKTWAQNLVLDIEAWRAGTADFETMETRLVIAGPPGTGKTTFARSVAQSAGIPLIATSAAAWFLKGGSYLDGVIKEIDAVFANAREQAPALLFIDEIDAIPDRGALSPRNRDWWMPVVGHLLTLIDGAHDENRELVIMGATNFPDRLDEALMRPGRLSRLINIGLPTQEEVSQILRQHLGDDLVDVELEGLVCMLPAATGAEVAELVRRARAAARRAKRLLKLEDLVTVLVPSDRRAEALVERVAIHEAGHAVVGHFLNPDSFKSVSIIASGELGGATVFEGADSIPTRNAVEGRVVQLLAGRAAEKLLLGSIGTGSGGRDQSDLAQATSLVAALHASLGLGDTLLFRGDFDDVGTLLRVNSPLALAVESELQSLHHRAEELVAKHASAIAAVSKQLLKVRFLARADFLAVIRDIEVANAI